MTEEQITMAVVMGLIAGSNLSTAANENEIRERVLLLRHQAQQIIKIAQE